MTPACLFALADFWPFGDYTGDGTARTRLSRAIGFPPFTAGVASQPTLMTTRRLNLYVYVRSYRNGSGRSGSWRFLQAQAFRVSPDGLVSTSQYWRPAFGVLVAARRLRPAHATATRQPRERRRTLDP